jgi:hypothetical protein
LEVQEPSSHWREAVPDGFVSRGVHSGPPNRHFMAEDLSLVTAGSHAAYVKLRCRVHSSGVGCPVLPVRSPQVNGECVSAFALGLTSWPNRRRFLCKFETVDMGDLSSDDGINGRSLWREETRMEIAPHATALTLAADHWVQGRASRDSKTVQAATSK